MFGTFRKHQSWLLAVIVGLTIISFAVFGPTNARMGNVFKGGGSNLGILAGKPITQDQLQNALREVDLDEFRKTQQWPNHNSAQTLQAAYMRLFMIEKQREWGIQIGLPAVAASAQQLLGQGTLEEFTEKVLKPQGLTAADFERFVRHELGLQQMIRVVGVSGQLVTPQEAETMYRLEHQDIESYLVYFSASNYLANVQVTPEALGQFYTNQLANYRVPEQVQVSYVKYNVTNYAAAAEVALTNLSQIVDGAVQKFGTNLFKGAKTPEESKANIRAEVIREHAMENAHRDASKFAQALDEMPHVPESLDKLAATSNQVVQLSPPFDREYGLMDFPTAFSQKAFGLDTNEPFAGPIVAEDGVYVIAFKQRIPSETPTMAKIQEKVTSDFRLMSAVQLAQQSAIKFSATMTNGLASGKSFQDVCTGASVKFEALPPFSLSTRDLNAPIESKISFNSIKQVAFSTPPGKISGLSGAKDGAFMIYVAKQLPVDEAKVKQETPEFLSYLRSVRQNEAFNRWFNSQINQDPDFLQTVKQLTENAPARSSARRAKT